MNFFESSTGKIVFFTKNSPEYLSGEYSVVLSPQFYWVKRVKLPVKSEYKAKKLAPSVFEGSLPEGEEYFYDVKHEKDRGTFIVIAYSKEYIYNAIREKFSPSAKIKGVYFAQYELEGLKSCIAIDKDISLGNVDGLLIQVPSVCVYSDDNVRKYIPKISLSTKKIKIDNLQASGDVGDYLYYIVFLVLFLLSQILTYSAYKSDLNFYDKQKIQITSKYHLPKTSFELNSIKKSLKKTLKEQRSMKNALIKLDKISFLKEEKIVSVVLKKGGGVFQIKTTKADVDVLLEKIKKEFSVRSANFEDGIVSIEVAL